MTDKNYSCELIEAIRSVKLTERWVEDEIHRVEHLESTLSLLIQRYINGLDKKLILDFGCGCGASSIVLGRLAAKVVGVEPKESSVRVAKIRVKEEGLAHQVVIEHLQKIKNLSFQDNSFDVAVAWGVIEHIPKKERPFFIKELWRVIKPEGYLFIGETPNRFFPYDAHTTQLWFITWIPLWLAKKYAMFRKRIKTTEEAIDIGMMGVTYWEIIKSLPRGNFEVVNLKKNDEVVTYYNIALRHKQGFFHRLIKLISIPFYILLNKMICKTFDIPLCVFLPTFPALCFKKIKEDLT
jgi:2-polyprenyl-3-methyl-5-hydroxy-6-metoxy-1,4-benzoquinol methylase